MYQRKDSSPEHDPHARALSEGELKVDLLDMDCGEITVSEVHDVHNVHGNLEDQEREDIGQVEETGRKSKEDRFRSRKWKTPKKNLFDVRFAVKVLHYSDCCPRVTEVRVKGAFVQKLSGHHASNFRIPEETNVFVLRDDEHHLALCSWAERLEKYQAEYDEVRKELKKIDDSYGESRSCHVAEFRRPDPRSLH